MKKFSYFHPPITNTRPSETITLLEAYNRILSSAYQPQTVALRMLDDPKAARLYKANNFPYVTFAGCFEKRSDKQLQQPSGLLVIDLDDLEEIESVKAALLTDPHYDTELLFVSPSGRGLKWVTSYPWQHLSHQQYFRELSAYLEAVYDLNPDPSGKDTSRACFLSHDPKAILKNIYLSENH